MHFLIRWPNAIVLFAVFLTFRASSRDDRIKEWGDISDPDRDCQFNLEGARLKIIVPGTTHDLSAELKKVNAPRVLRDIEGDFIVQVMVVGTVHPSGSGTVTSRLPFNGAGLLLWQDAANYVRLERSAIIQGNQLTSYALFESRSKGRAASSPSFKIPDRDIYLRLERRGTKVYASVSPDGNQWQALQPITIDLSNKLKLGVAAINTASEPFTAEFEAMDVFLRRNAEPTSNR